MKRDMRVARRNAPRHSHITGLQAAII